jgi:hypothetical protein
MLDIFSIVGKLHTKILKQAFCKSVQNYANQIKQCKQNYFLNECTQLAPSFRSLYMLLKPLVKSDKKSY